MSDPQRWNVDRDTIGLVLASTLAGLAVLLAVVALARQPFLLLVAVPFAVGAYLVWRGATGQFSGGLTGGRFRERVREGEQGGRGPYREGRGQARRGPFRQARTGRRGSTWTTGRRDPREAERRGEERRERRAAYRVLGLSPDANAAAVRAAYREKVKTTHPDADEGDRETFQRVNAAYELLKE